jgi:hypothetical protein
LDSACLLLLHVTTAVMALGERVHAGDEDAKAQVGELARVLEHIPQG